MKIVWLGHSCFKIILENGKVLVFDPYDDTCGYENKPIKADYVVSTHDHFDHNCLDYISGDYQLVNKPEGFKNSDISVSGFMSYHDKTGGSERGENIIFKLEAEGISVLHLGDLGIIPDEDFIKRLGTVDILLIPVGGVYTIDADEALDIINSIAPNIIIPMHYRTEVLKMDIAPVTEFLNATNGVYDYSMLGKNEFSITSNDLKKRTRVIIMEYS